MSERINIFRDLRVYQEACTLDLEIFEVSKHFPREEQYSLIDQRRRTSRAVGANIADAWAKQRYPAHFFGELTDADGDARDVALAAPGDCIRVFVVCLAAKASATGRADARQDDCERR